MQRLRLLALVVLVLGVVLTLATASLANHEGGHKPPPGHGECPPGNGYGDDRDHHDKDRRDDDGRRGDKNHKDKNREPCPPECKPGHGHGDPNHCHTGPPGQRP